MFYDMIHIQKKRVLRKCIRFWSIFSSNLKLYWFKLVFSIWFTIFCFWTFKGSIWTVPTTHDAMIMGRTSKKKFHLTNRSYFLISFIHLFLFKNYRFEALIFTNHKNWYFYDFMYLSRLKNLRTVKWVYFWRLPFMTSLLIKSRWRHYTNRFRMFPDSFTFKNESSLRNQML